MNRVFLSYILGVCICLLLRCSSSPIAQDGSSSEVIAVFGIVVDKNGVKQENVKVNLVPSVYNPRKDSMSVKIFSDTTDKEGFYRFQVPEKDTGLFTLQGIHLSTRNRLLKFDIDVISDSVFVAADTVNIPGSVKVFLPDSADALNGYLYIPGTTLFFPLNGDSIFTIMDSIPAELIPLIKYAETDQLPETLIRQDLLVSSGDTVIVTMPSWKYSKRIVLNTGTTGADVSQTCVNFPVLVRLTGADFDFGLAESDGRDIRFTKADNRPLDFEIERWDPVLGEAAVWVRVDTIWGNNSTQYIVMCWGNQAASLVSDGPAVFGPGNGYNGVWHLNRGSDDATGNGYGGTEYGVVDTIGNIGYCKKFSGSDSIRIAGLLGSPSSVTISTWARLDLAGDTGSEVVSVGDAVLLRMDDTRFNKTCGTMASYQISATTNADYYSRQFLEKTGWHFLAFTVNSATQKQYFYIDGVVVDSGSTVNPILYTGAGSNTVIGAHGNRQTSIYGFCGLIDEVRFCSAPFSADYVKLCYMNQKQDDWLVEFRN